MGKSIERFERRFHEGRLFLRRRNWKLGRSKVEESLAISEKAGLGPHREMMARILTELDFYFEARVSPKVVAEALVIDQIRRRPTQTFREPHTIFPSVLFEFDVDNVTYVGRKAISEKWLDYSIGELHCSAVSAAMLTGVLHQSMATKEQVVIEYHPLTKGEKLTLFKKLSETTELKFPYPRRDKSGKECEATGSGWEYDAHRAEALNAGESHLRAHTLKFLQGFDLRQKKIYDPSCSTGDFLRAIKEKFPSSHVIGQDLSASMIKHARHKIDEAYIGNALKSPIPNDSVDFIFIRFLNHEVVSIKNAQKLFSAITKRAKPDGRIILLGHTPVILNADFFAKSGYQVLQSLAHSSDRKTVFPFYVLALKA